MRWDVVFVVSFLVLFAIFDFVAPFGFDGDDGPDVDTEPPGQEQNLVGAGRFELPTSRV